jgi:hypothetical protein
MSLRDGVMSNALTRPPRVPGAAQHEVVRRRPGTPVLFVESTATGVPDQRCTIR